jgi:PAS domain S-box-containing protein
LSITAKLLKFYGKSAILTIAKNITPEKIAKAEKEGIQNEYKNLFNMSPLPTFLVSKDDRVMMSNNAAQELSQELYGCRLDSNSDFSKIFSPEQFKHISKERSKHIKKEGISTFDLDVVTPKGKKEFRVTYSAPNTEGSRVIVARDLSVLKHLKKEGRSVRKELRESEKKHKTLFESSSDAIMTLAPPQWKFTNGNPATIKMFKAKDEAEFNSKGPWELSPRYQPDGQISEVKAKQMIMNAMKEGSNFFEWTHKRINGEEFPATVLLTKIERCGRELLQATVRDITEQKKAEDALKFGSLILNNINDSVIVTDIDGKIKSWNLGSVRIFGYSAEEMIGKSIVQVTKPEERESVAPKQLESLRNGDMHFREWEGVRKDGSPVWLLLSTNIMSNSTGKTVGMVGIGKDITNHKKTEEMLNEHKNVFDTVLNNSSDAIFLIGSDHKYKWINKKCGEIMNLDPNEYIGKTAGISIHEEDKQKSIQNFKSAMNGEIVKYQARLHSLDGRIRHLDIRLQSLTCDGEKCVLGFASETSKNNFITP